MMSMPRKRSFAILLVLLLATLAIAAPGPSPSPARSAYQLCMAVPCPGRWPACHDVCEQQRHFAALVAKRAHMAAEIARGDAHRCGHGPYLLTIEQTICPQTIPLGAQYVWMRTAQSGDHYVWGGFGPTCNVVEREWTDWPECGGLPE